ncbi:MAG: alpha/beta hydrolase [Verrucomicrobiota bacterium]
MPEELQIRVHGDSGLPTLIYLPGLHGDWTLVTSFSKALEGRVRFVEFTYPRTTEWSLRDYARAVEQALAEHEITAGWLLGESFGSQIVWEVVDESRQQEGDAAGLTTPHPRFLSPWRGEGSTGPNTRFKVQGVILAGGFVRHPMIPFARLAEGLMRGMPLSWLRAFLFFYAKYARFRHRHAPETFESVKEFVARRTGADKQAMAHRLRLVAESDPREQARRVSAPVFHVAGFFDPIVPWFPAQRWLRRNCPGFRAAKVIASADHNVLGTAPREAAEQVLEWMSGAAAKGRGLQPASAQLGRRR